MQRFKSVREFSERLAEGPLTLVSSVYSLGYLDLFLQGLSSGDMPAHTRRCDAKKSFFGGAVSHGVGTLARAEGLFVELVASSFTVPVEFIARGYRCVKYSSPLRVGEMYRYRYELSNARLRPNRLDFDCKIICEVIGSNARVVSEARWRPSVIEHEDTIENSWRFKPQTRLTIPVELFLRWVMPTLIAFFLVVGLFGSPPRWRPSDSAVCRSLPPVDQSCCGP
jgi:acyl dehydratase